MDVRSKNSRFDTPPLESARAAEGAETLSTTAPSGTDTFATALASAIKRESGPKPASQGKPVATEKTPLTPRVHSAKSPNSPLPAEPIKNGNEAPLRERSRPAPAPAATATGSSKRAAAPNRDETASAKGTEQEPVEEQKKSNPKKGTPLPPEVVWTGGLWVQSPPLETHPAALQTSPECESLTCVKATNTGEIRQNQSNDTVAPQNNIDIKSLLGSQRPLVTAEALASLPAQMQPLLPQRPQEILPENGVVAPNFISNSVQYEKGSQEIKNLVLPYFDSISIESSFSQETNTVPQQPAALPNAQITTPKAALEQNAELTRLLTKTMVWGEATTSMSPKRSLGENSELTGAVEAMAFMGPKEVSPTSEPLELQTMGKEPLSAPIDSLMPQTPRENDPQKLTLLKEAAPVTPKTMAQAPQMVSLDKAPLLPLSSQVETPRRHLPSTDTLPATAGDATGAKITMAPNAQAAVIQTLPTGRQNRGEGAFDGEQREKSQKGGAIDEMRSNTSPASTAATLKSNDTTATTPTADDNVARSTFERVRQNATRLAAQGGGTAKIHINDSKVGQVELEIKMGSGNTIHVEVKSRNAKLREALEEHIGDLKESLGQHKLQLVEFKIVTDTQSARNDADLQRGNNPPSQNNQQQSAQQDSNTSRRDSGGRPQGEGFNANAKTEKNSPRTNISSKTNVQRGANGSLKITA